MAQYTTGTVSCTASSGTLTGSGTAWQTAGIAGGDILFIDDSRVPYVVSSVASETSLSIVGTFPETLAGVEYVIHKDFTSLGFPLLNQGDLNAAQIYSKAMERIDARLAALGVLPDANAGVIYVRKDGDDTDALSGFGAYLTIQAAIDAAASGDVVIVFPGTYSEQVTLKSGVSLVGWDRATTIISHTASTVNAPSAGGSNMRVANLWIKATTGDKAMDFETSTGSLSNVSCSGLIVECSGASAADALFFAPADSGASIASFENCFVRASTRAVTLYDATNVAFTDCWIETTGADSDLVYIKTTTNEPVWFTRCHFRATGGGTHEGVKQGSTSGTPDIKLAGCTFEGLSADKAVVDTEGWLSSSSLHVTGPLHIGGDLSVADASQARTALGLSGLDAIAGLAKTDGNIIVGNGTTWVATATDSRTLHVSAAVGDDSNSGTILTPFETIGAAITAASAGDCVVIHPGTYSEQVTLKSGVSLRGVDRALCIITATDDTVQVPASGVSNARVSGLTMRATGATGAGQALIFLTPVSAAHSDLVFRDCVIESTDATGIDALTYNNTGTPALPVRFEGCVFRSERDPIFVQSGGDVVFQSCSAYVTGSSVRAAYLTGGSSRLISFANCHFSTTGSSNIGVAGIGPVPTNVHLACCSFKGFVAGSEVAGLTTSQITGVTVGIDGLFEGDVVVGDDLTVGGDLSLTGSVTSDLTMGDGADVTLTGAGKFKLSSNGRIESYGNAYINASYSNWNITSGSTADAQVKLINSSSGSSVQAYVREGGFRVRDMADSEALRFTVANTGEITTTNDLILYDGADNRAYFDSSTNEFYPTAGGGGYLGKSANRWDAYLKTANLSDDLTMGAGADINVSDTGKIWFGADVNLYRNVANQLATDDGFRAGGVITSGTIWSSHSDNGADATTWLGTNNTSTTGSFETNVFGQFRNASNTAVTQFIAFRGITRTAGAEYGEIALRPIVNGARADVAKADYRGLVLGTGRALYVGSTQVVGAQQAYVAAPTGGATVDAEARAALIDLIDKLATHGLIGTEP